MILRGQRLRGGKAPWRRVRTSLLSPAMVTSVPAGTKEERRNAVQRASMYGRVSRCGDERGAAALDDGNVWPLKLRSGSSLQPAA
jgi:hypothetical protein